MKIIRQNYSFRYILIYLLKLVYQINKLKQKEQHYSSLRYQMRRRQTITQQYSPTFRRRLSRNYLQLNLESSLKHMDSERDSARLKSQATDFNEMVAKAQEHFSHFIDHNLKINKIIDEVDLIIRNRMNAHEQGLISVVKTQIENMQYECHKIVQQYNEMMNQKSKSTEIDSLRNELDYFRTSALSFYQMHKKILKQNQQLRKQITQKYQIIEQLSSALRKTTKKYIKQKAGGASKSFTERKNKAHYFINNIQTEISIANNYEDEERLHTQNPSNKEIKSIQKLVSTKLLEKQRILSSENCQRIKKVKNERKLSYQNQELNDKTNQKPYSQCKSRSHKYKNPKSYCKTNISTDMGNKQDEKEENKKQSRKELMIKVEDANEIRNQSFRRSKAKTNKNNDCLREKQKGRYRDQDNEQEQGKNREKIYSTQILQKQKESPGRIYVDSHLKKRKIKQKQQNCGKSNSFWKFHQNPADQNQKRSSWVNY